MNKYFGETKPGSASFLKNIKFIRSDGRFIDCRRLLKSQLKADKIHVFFDHKRTKSGGFKK